MRDWQNPQKAMAHGFDFAPRVQLAHNKLLNSKLETGRALEKPWQTVETLRLVYKPEFPYLKL